MAGKARRELLSRITSLAGARREDVLVAPHPLLDAGVIEGRKGRYVWATDPALGVPREHLGILAFHFTAADVAVMGGKPEFLAVDILMPEGSPKGEAVRIASQIHEEAVRYGASVVTGHTGWYSAVNEPVVVVTAAGRAERMLHPRDALPGDRIVLAGLVGAELLYSLAHFRPSLMRDLLGEAAVRRWRAVPRELTVLDSAMALNKRGLAVIMKDGAEGGLVRALNDLADATGLGFHVEEDRIPIPPELRRLAGQLNFDPLSASSSGLLIALVRPEWVREAVWYLEILGIPVSVAGSMSDRRERWILGPEGRRPFPEEAEDPYASLMHQG